jgi:phospholipase/carboxylesterase
MLLEAKDMAVIRFPPASRAKPNSLLVLLHGVGSDVASLEPLGQVVREALRDSAVIIPDAPLPFDLSDHGHQWFSINGVTDLNRHSRIEAALPWIEDFIKREAQNHGLPFSRIGVCGFSQGAMMALALADCREPPVAIVSIAGRIARYPLPSTNAAPQLLLTHGTADQTVPFACLGEASSAFVIAGYSVLTLPIAGHGHHITSQQAKAVAQFFSDVFETELAAAMS